MTEYLSWRWVFLINLPLGLCAWLIAHKRLVGLPIPQRKPVIDYLGTLLMIVGLTSLLLAITEIGQGRSVLDVQMSGLLGIALLGLGTFVWHERRTAEPLLPMHLFANRSAVMCWIAVFFTSFQSISLTVLIPLRFQTVTGSGADSAALHLLPLALGMPLGAYLGGRHTSRSGRYKPIILLGTLVLPFSLTGLAFVAPQSVWFSTALMLLTGIAAGLQFPTSLVGSQNSVQPKDIGIATSTSNLFRALGGAVGVACMSALLLAMLQHSGIAELSGHTNGAQAASSNVLLEGLRSVDATATQLREQLALTFRELFLISAAISLLALANALAMPNVLLRGRADNAR